MGWHEDAIVVVAIDPAVGLCARVGAAGILGAFPACEKESRDRVFSQGLFSESNLPRRIAGFGVC
jgi:hypothetical protein